MGELYRRLDGHTEVRPLLEGTDEDALVALDGKPALVRIPGTDPAPRGRLIGCLLHGNEDSGFRAALDVLRSGERFPFDLWVLIGNVRAASTGGWFAHRYLDDQEDFNRVWGLEPPTTGMRRCAAAMLAELADADLEAVVDLHNNTGDNPPYVILPTTTSETVGLAGVCADTGLIWRLGAHTLMEAMSASCASVALESGRAGLDASARFAREALGRFLSAEALESDGPSVVFEIISRVTVRPEVRFAFGAPLTDDLDLVLHPGLDGANFGMLLAGTELGQIQPGAALPLVAHGMRGADVTERYLHAHPDGRLVLTQDVTPVMMTTTVQQTRRDCLFYCARRRR